MRYVLMEYTLKNRVWSDWQEVGTFPDISAAALRAIGPKGSAHWIDGPVLGSWEVSGVDTCFRIIPVD